jgi:hypothetical protein
MRSPHTRHRAKPAAALERANGFEARGGVFPGDGRVTGQAQRSRELEKKLRDVTMERDILKMVRRTVQADCLDGVYRWRQCIRPPCGAVESPRAMTAW